MEKREEFSRFAGNSADGHLAVSATVQDAASNPLRRTRPDSTDNARRSIPRAGSREFSQHRSCRVNLQRFYEGIDLIINRRGQPSDATLFREFHFNVWRTVEALAIMNKKASFKQVKFRWSILRVGNPRLRIKSPLRVYLCIDIYIDALSRKLRLFSKWLKWNSRSNVDLTSVKRPITEELHREDVSLFLSLSSPVSTSITSRKSLIRL